MWAGEPDQLCAVTQTREMLPHCASVDGAPIESVSMPWRLYPRNDSPTPDRELFHAPTAEYRGTPFWSWNTKLNVGQLLHQIEQFKQMGFGGFHIHARTGLATEYLGPEFMAAVR